MRNIRDFKLGHYPTFLLGRSHRLRSVPRLPCKSSVLVRFEFQMGECIPISRFLWRECFNQRISNEPRGWLIPFLWMVVKIFLHDGDNLCCFNWNWSGPEFHVYAFCNPYDIPHTITI